MLSAPGKMRFGIIGITSPPRSEGFREQAAEMRVRPIVRKLQHVAVWVADHAADETAVMALLLR